MSRLTLRLPESLHRQLETRAKREGISLNQYLVYALTCHLGSGYTVEAVSDSAVREQQEAYAALVAGLGQASAEDVQEQLDRREPMPPEPELDAEAAAGLRRRLEGQRSKK